MPRMTARHVIILPDHMRRCGGRLWSEDSGRPASPPGLTALPSLRYEHPLAVIASRRPPSRGSTAHVDEFLPTHICSEAAPCFLHMHHDAFDTMHIVCTQTLVQPNQAMAVGPTSSLPYVLCI